MKAEKKISQLIKDLDNFKTRKSAKTALVEMGDECVDMLVKKLLSPLRDNVKWNIIDILSRIGSEKAVPAFRECAKNPTFENVCNEAIKKITGIEPEKAADTVEEEESSEQEAAEGERDIPESAPAEQTQAEKPVKEKQEPEVKVIEKVVEKVVEVEKETFTPEKVKILVEELIKEQGYSDVKPVTSGDRETGYRFTIKTDKERRRQKITVCYDTTDEDNEKIICLYSICCEAKVDYYENALRWNQNIANGSICITDFKKKPHFVLLKHLSFEEVDKKAVLKLIESLGERADKIEKVLTGAQDFR